MRKVASSFEQDDVKWGGLQESSAVKNRGESELIREDNF